MLADLLELIELTTFTGNAIMHFRIFMKQLPEGMCVQGVHILWKLSGPLPPSLVNSNYPWEEGWRAQQSTIKITPVSLAQQQLFWISLTRIAATRFICAVIVCKRNKCILHFWNVIAQDWELSVTAWKLVKSLTYESSLFPFEVGQAENLLLLFNFLGGGESSSFST